MKQASIPSPQAMLQRHGALIRLIVLGLQSGTIHAQSYADWQNEPVDRYLAPALVRKGAKRFLLKHGQQVAEEEQGDVADLGPVPEFVTENLSNIGLALSTSGARLRILRSDHGAPPAPGPSKLRQLFYAQQVRFDFEGRGQTEQTGNSSEAPEPSINLVVHWETDDRYNLDRVSIACPMSGGTTRDSVHVHWNRSVWRRRIAEDAEAIAEADSADLDISLDESEEGTGTEE